MELLSFILASYGMTMILVYSKIFEVVRTKLNSLNSKMLTYILKCCMCMGFWVGAINSICFFELGINWFMAACISSGTSYFISRLVDDDGILVKFKNN